eukprot:TRINITY_DN1864_c0_g1_i1.p1 TRINITY_DN1864_c0_g1~~TRINITY_DN1864_c0_g1_i1.p1  ORF type:complete len:482 (+),score=153.10 TRINITY_DN1864_c0_g1_i1:46-1491(+)
MAAARLGGYALGLVLLVCVALIWVGASQLIQAIFKDMNFNHPFFLTYFNTCGFALWFGGALWKKEWRRFLPPCCCCGPASDELEGYDVVACPPSDGSEAEGQPAGTACAAAPVTWRTYASCAAKFTPMWMLANYAFNLSLTYASVASNSILSNTSSLWTMLICVCVYGEKAGVAKVGSVLLIFTGAVLVAVAEEQSASPEVMTKTPVSAWSGFTGSLLSLFAAVCYAVYTVQLREHVPEGVIMPLFFAYVGVYVLVGGAPVLLGLHITGIEPFHLPPPNVLGFLALNALLGTNISDVLWAKAVILTSPVVATLALSLTIPLGMLSDAVLHGKTFTWMYISGAWLVLVGFVLVNVAGKDAPCSTAKHVDDEVASDSSSPTQLVSPSSDVESGKECCQHAQLRFDVQKSRCCPPHKQLVDFYLTDGVRHGPGGSRGPTFPVPDAATVRHGGVRSRGFFTEPASPTGAPAHGTVDPGAPAPQRR